jgi:hypothetical protein
MWPSLVKIQYTELKLSCGNDPVVKNSIYSNGDLDLWPIDPILKLVLPRTQGNHVAKFGKDPIYRTKVIVRKPNVNVHPPPAILNHIIRPVYKKNRQYNKKVKKDKKTNKEQQNVTHKTKDWATRTQFKTVRQLGCGRLSSPPHTHTPLAASDVLLLSDMNHYKLVCKSCWTSVYIAYLMKVIPETHGAH